MKENNRKGHECPPVVDDPAPQPNPPNGPEDCKCPSPIIPVPPLDEPVVCKEPKCGCKCPDPGSSTSDCLETFVSKRTGDTGAAEQASLKAELVKLVETAKKAKQDYSRDVYKDLVEQWKKQDRDIADLLRKLECSVWCWDCIFKCHVCAFLHELRKAEILLQGNGEMYANVHHLYDQRYWLECDRIVKLRSLNRIKSVLKAWESPSASIQKALNENKKLIETSGPLLGTQPGKAIYDIFFKLVPLHLAIAPQSGGEIVTKIDARFTTLCGCCETKPGTDTETTDDESADTTQTGNTSKDGNGGTEKECPEPDPSNCCGPEVGELSFRERLIPPQANLIDPNDYFKLICCLVERRYEPAVIAIIDVDRQLAELKSTIDRHEKAIGQGWQGEFEKNAKAAIPSVIDCCEYEIKPEPEPEPDCDEKKEGEEKQENPNQHDQAA